MVAQGEWADVDDYRLIGELYSLDATCMEDVDWDGLVEDRRWGRVSKALEPDGFAYW
ncbi:hypothetical protein CASFOL_001165 [Castilleja foliolosa]|uniref:Uncharacterized protein n=1 Tax=Castilleja foliolosa TaxID=1961234 RepID=A0ABD3EMC1_9LAMI